MSIIPQNTTTENSFHFTVDTFLKNLKLGQYSKTAMSIKLKEFRVLKYSNSCLRLS